MNGDVPVGSADADVVAHVAPFDSQISTPICPLTRVMLSSPTRGFGSFLDASLGHNPRRHAPSNAGDSRSAPAFRGSLSLRAHRSITLTIRRYAAAVAHAGVRLLPASLALPVPFGPLRGMRWTVRSADLGCYLGTYEGDVQRALADHASSGSVVYDVGANVGFFTLMAAALVGPIGRVVAFEPMSETVAHLRRHVGLNALGQVTVIEAAASDHDGRLRFGGLGTLARTDPDGERHVRAVAIDTLWRSGEIPTPNVVKLDVEGSELPALRGMRAVLAAAHPVLLIEFHGARKESPDDDGLVRAMLRELGYELTVLPSGETVATFPGSPRSLM